jgi:predicted PurR-regulated permease PerM
MPAPETLFSTLSGPQRRLVGFAAGFIALAVSVALVAGLVAGLAWLLGYFSGVIWPVAAAGILALIFRPTIDGFQRRLRFGRVTAVLLLYGLVAIAVAILMLCALPPLASQVDELVRSLPDLWHRALNYWQRNLPAWAQSYDRLTTDPAVSNLGQTLSDEAQKIPGRLFPSLAAAGSGLLGLLVFLAHLVLVPLFLFFLLLMPSVSADRIAAAHLPFLPPAWRRDVAFLGHEFVGIVVAFFRGQLLIGSAMGVLYGTGFALVGVKFGILLGLLVGLLNTVPYLGTITGLLTVLPLALLQPEGGGKLLGEAFAVMVAVQGVESWVLTPQIMGNRTGLHPMAITISFLFWTTALGGFAGLVLAVPLTAFLVIVWRFLRLKYWADPAAGAVEAAENRGLAPSGKD